MLDITASVYKHAPKLVEKLPKPFLNLFIKTLKLIFHEKMFFKIHEKNKHLSGLPFVSSMLENLNISCTVKPDEMHNIPSTGKLLVIANHPTGAVDTMVLIQAIANAREDKKIKIVANGMVMGIHQIASLLVPVDNINGAITKHSLKIINTALENNEAVIVFPAGVVNRLSLKGLKDIPWKASFLKIAKRTQTPILPIKIKGSNSPLFYIMSMLLPKPFSALFLVHEFAIAGKRKPIHLSIGKVIPSHSFDDASISIAKYVDMFYAHVYAIGTKKGDILETETTIENPCSRKQLKKEVDAAQFLGYANNGNKIILANAEDFPFLMSELGRVREISFRAINSGTGTAKDNDAYDDYYKHLILWDDNDLEIVGAYRIGECNEIIKNKGKEGLYITNFCYLNQYFSDYTSNSMELGRSFIQPKYWGSRAFDSLWQAVTVYLAYNPHIQYSFGFVSISADTPQKGVAALVYFYTHYFSCHTNMMEAKTPYRISDENQKEFDALFKDLSYKEGFIVLKRYLKDLGTVVPTLVKQYVELYEEGAVRYFSFCIDDPRLRGMTAGFIIADNYRMKKSIQERNLKEFNKIKNTDSLTQLHSSEHFTKLVTAESKHLRQTDLESSLVLFTIMCEYEEEIRHKILQRVARALKNSLRQDDILARWEENSFIIMFKNTDASQVQPLSKNLQGIIEELTITNKYPFKCSFEVVNQDKILVC